MATGAQQLDGDVFFMNICDILLPMVVFQKKKNDETFFKIRFLTNSEL